LDNLDSANMHVLNTTIGEPPDVLHCLGKQNLPGNGESTDSTPSLSYKVSPCINDFPGSDFQVPELHG